MTPLDKAKEFCRRLNEMEKELGIELHYVDWANLAVDRTIFAITYNDGWCVKED